MEKEFRIHVGRQLNVLQLTAGLGGAGVGSGQRRMSTNDRHIMSDEEYYKRYGHGRGAREVVNFIRGAR